MDHPSDSPAPPQGTVTYLFTTRRLVVLGVLCVVLGVLLLGHVGGDSSSASAPSTAAIPPAASDTFSPSAPASPAPLLSVPYGTPTPTAASSPASTGAPAMVPAGPSGVDRGAPTTVSTVNVTDAAAVGGAFVTTSFSYDTTLDVSPTDAQRRSIPFVAPAYASQLRAARTQPGGDRWSTLADHHGYTTPTLAENHDGGRPPDTPTTAVRSWMVTTTGHSADGWTAPMGTALVFVTMIRTSPAAPWQVSGVQIPSAT